MRTTRTDIIKQAERVVAEVRDNLNAAGKERKAVPVAKARPFKWDFPVTADIGFFDARLSYELSGYRPITKTEGLDFRPEWFTGARDEFLATGHYTSYLPGSKGYRDFWHEEYRRCRQGYTVNGYTVTGEHYFFLNYYNLPLVEEGTRAGSGRNKDFPRFFVSQYQFFHYVDLAKRLHKHIALMKARGIGFSEISASMAANMYTTVRESVTMVACYDKGKLERTLSKVWSALQFLDTKTDGGMFKLRQLSDTALVKQSGHYNMSRGNKTPAGWQSMIEGVVADDPQKIRGDRVDLMILDEAGCHAPGTEVMMHDGRFRKVEDIRVGDMVMGDDGTPRTVLELHSGEDVMYRITPRHGDVQVVNGGHVLYGKRLDRGRGTYVEFTMTAREFHDMLRENPRDGDGYRLVRSDAVGFPHRDVPIDPYVFGFWLGAGDAGGTRFSTGDPGVIEYLRGYCLGMGCDMEVEDCPGRKRVFLSGKGGRNPFSEALRSLGVLGHKDIPDIYLYNDRDTLLQMLAGFVDAGHGRKRRVMEISRREGLEHLIRKLGFACGLLGMDVSTRVRVTKDGVRRHCLRIHHGHDRIPCKVPGNRGVGSACAGSGHGGLDVPFRIERLSQGKYYGFSLDGNQLFLLRDFTVCHNSWPQSIKAFVQAQALVEVQGVAFGTIQAGGTGGDKGPALAGLSTLYYHPEPYGILPYRHNYTADGSTILSGYFIPAFTQSMVPGMTDERGYCDEERNKEYFQAKRDQYLNVPQSLIHYCAEYCWTAEEAFAMEGDNKFNKILLSEQLAQIRLHKNGPRPVAGYMDYVYKDGIHKPENISGYKWTPARDGKIQILEHPVWSECYKQDIKRQEMEATRRNLPFERPPVYKEMTDLYVAGIDGIDIGKNQTSSETKDPSDFCLVIKRRAFGLREPQVVCVYKDRPNEIRTAYKTAMCLVRYYNCKVNVEATRVGFINWARYSNQLKWFMRRPQATLQNVKNGNSRSYGTPATAAIIEMQTDLIANFVEDYCHTIWFEEILDQLVRYNDENKTKFDLIAAMGMVELADQDLTGRMPLTVQPADDVFEDFGYYIDEYGYKRFGVIPKQGNPGILYGGGQAYDPYRTDSTDPRLHQGVDWS